MDNSIYAMFKTHALSNGGSPILDCLTFLPEIARFESINREYFDIMGVVFISFIFMVLCEFSRIRSELLITLIAGFAGVVCALALVLRSTVSGEGMTQLLGWELSVFELALFVNCALFSVIWISRVTVCALPRPVRSLQMALRTALARWAAGLLIFTLTMGIFISHPLYASGFYENWRITVSYLYLIYFFAGLPYAFITNWLRKGVAEDRKDSGLIFLLLTRAAFRRLSKSRTGSFSTVIKNQGVRSVLLDLGVKFFFIPLMVTFVFSTCGEFFRHFPLLLESLANLLENPNSYFDVAYTPGQPNKIREMFSQFYFSAYHGIFVMDVGLGLVGYICASRWLGNKSKSVESTLFGWMAALICYPPFNSVASDYMPYSRSLGDVPYLAFTQYGVIDTTTALTLIDALDVILKLITLAAFTLYVYATMAFGLRFSNLTNRGIIARGPYGWVRHPAYISKNIAWWAESVRNFSSLWQIVFLAGWNYIYYLRAITEERHLMRDPDYRAYCEKVRHRFIPGLI